MRLKCVGTGSRGNCYLLEGEDEVLVLEAGIRFEEVKKALNFDISKIVGVCVSHEHGDHAKYVGEYEKSGIPTFKPYESFAQYKAFGKFTIMPIRLIHDVPCYGFYVTHEAFGNLLYASDTRYIREVFTGYWALNHILIEANYADWLLDPNAPNYAHVKEGHMSIDTTVEFLRVNENPGLTSVMLCHLSDRNSDEAAFLDLARQAAKCPVYAAAAGREIELREAPF